MAKRKKQHDVEPDPEPTKRNPETMIGLESGSDVLYVDLPEGSDPRQSKVSYGGANYEASAVDGDGVWIYRHRSM